ncbi:MAG: hypothetical protein HZC55_09775 [Verrucomicrobia bacterium]|nr:hypothetical protein [Verrucomicrobiota bacterium]
MKKWMYLIFPGIMLVGFVFIYLGHVEETHRKEEEAKKKVAQERADLEAKKKAAEAKAREDAKKRQDERDAEEKKKEDEKAAKQAADDKKVADATAEYTAKGDAAQKQVTALEQELDRLRKEKDKTSRESFDLAKQVELARIARRNAELEIQRMTEMVHRRASDSSLVRPPAVPTPPPAKKG